MSDVAKVMKELGFLDGGRTKKMAMLRHRALAAPVYFRLDSRAQLPLRFVVAPTHDLSRLTSIKGVVVQDDYLHHSNLREFPTRRHGGKTDIHFGKQVVCADMTALSAALHALITH